MRRLNVRFVAALAICALLPVTTANAKVSVSRPFNIRGHAQQVININTGEGTVEAEGLATHLGRITLLGSGTRSLFSGTIVAANGDKIFYDFDNDVMTFTGGSGRFKNASGECSIVGNILTYDVIGTLLTITVDFTGSGTITY